MLPQAQPQYIITDQRMQLSKAALYLKGMYLLSMGTAMVIVNWYATLVKSIAYVTNKSIKAACI